MNPMIKSVLCVLAGGAAISGVGLLTAGCDSDKGTPPVVEEQPTLIERLRSAPEEVHVAGHRFFLETQVVRDFFPPHPPGGWPMYAIIWLVEADSQQIPETVDMTRLWVVREDDEIWETELTELPWPKPYVKLMKWADDGPKWEPHIYVDVVVRVTHADGVSCLLRAADQYIWRED